MSPPSACSPCGQRPDRVDARLRRVAAVGVARRPDRARLLLGHAPVADRGLDALLGLEPLRRDVGARGGRRDDRLLQLGVEAHLHEAEADALEELAAERVVEVALERRRRSSSGPRRGSATLSASSTSPVAAAFGVLHVRARVVQLDAAVLADRLAQRVLEDRPELHVEERDPALVVVVRVQPVERPHAEAPVELLDRVLLGARAGTAPGPRSAPAPRRASASRRSRSPRSPTASGRPTGRSCARSPGSSAALLNAPMNFTPRRRLADLLDAAPVERPALLHDADLAGRHRLEAADRRRSGRSGRARPIAAPRTIRRRVDRSSCIEAELRRVYRKACPSPRYVGTVSTTRSPRRGAARRSARTARRPSRGGRRRRRRPAAASAAGAEQRRLHLAGALQLVELQPGGQVGERQPVGARRAARRVAAAERRRRRRGPGRRTTGSANSAAGRGAKLGTRRTATGAYSPEPAATSVTASSRTVRSTLPVPPPLTNSRSAATARTASTTRAAPRARARAPTAAASARIAARPSAACPAARRRRRRSAPRRPSPRRAGSPAAPRRAARTPRPAPGVCSGERRAPTRTRPPSGRHDVSRSRQTRTGARRPAPRASTRSSCAGSSTMSVIVRRRVRVGRAARAARRGRRSGTRRAGRGSRGRAATAPRAA